MKSIDTLVEDIHALFEGDRFKASEREVQIFGHNLATRIGLRIGEERGKPSLRLSNLGSPCNRKLWYSINKPDSGEKLAPEVHLKFLFGDILEELLLWLARLAGHEVTDEQKEVNLNGVLGHIDGKIDGVLVDCKSASSYSFNKFEQGLHKDQDSFGYLVQLDSYLHADDGDTGAFLAIDKTLGKICLDKHDKSTVDYKKIVEEKQEMLAHKEPPPRGYPAELDGKSGNEKLGVVCSYCQFKKECWPGLRTFLYANGPRYLTTVVREPKDGVKEVIDGD